MRKITAVAVVALLCLPSSCWAVFDLFVPKDAMREVINTFTNSKVYYVYNGTVNKYALQFKISVLLRVNKLHFCWVSRSQRDTPYSIAFTVDNKLAMLAPQLNISNRGLVPKTVSGFEVSLQCTGARTAVVLVGIHINVSTPAGGSGPAINASTTMLSIYRTKLCSAAKDAVDEEPPPPSSSPAVSPDILGPVVDGGTATKDFSAAAPDDSLDAQDSTTTLLKQSGLSGRALLISLGASGASMLMIAALIAVYFWRSKAAYSIGKSGRYRRRQPSQTRSGAQLLQPPLSALTLHQHQQHQLQLQQQQQQQQQHTLNPAYHRQLHSGCSLQQQQGLQQSRSRGFCATGVDNGSVGSGYTSCSLPSHHHQTAASPATERRLVGESRDEIVREALIPWDRVTLKCILMEGTFGRLYRANLSTAGGAADGGSSDDAAVMMQQEVEVLIKTVTDSANLNDIDEFTRCGVLLWGQQHANVSHLLAVTQIPGDPRPHLVYPYPAEGNLRLYLSRCRSAQSVSAYCVLSTQQLLHMAVQIAKGLAHLHKRRIVHGDLACRNCVLTSDYTVKISDAALATDFFPEDYYPLDCGGPSWNARPVKWMSVESLADGRISQAGDVWSFGVTLWELITRCLPPYPHTQPKDMLNYLTAGHRLGKPTNCPDQLFSIMASCWSPLPEARPRVANLQSALAQFHETLSAYV